MKGPGERTFVETSRRYFEEICRTDFLARAEILGVEVANRALVIPIYDEVYYFSTNGIIRAGGEESAIPPAVQVMICKYILTYSANTLPFIDNELVTYREFKDSGPLTSYFTTNTNKTLESAFAGNIVGLRRRVLQLGGEIADSNIYDLAVRFLALPHIPVYLNFNDQDDSFPATCSLLYHASAANFLDMECLAMTGTLLTGKLLANR